MTVSKKLGKQTPSEMLENDLQLWVPFKVQNSRWLCRHSADPLEAGSFEAAEKRAEGSSERVSRLGILDLTSFREFNPGLRDGSFPNNHFPENQSAGAPLVLTIPKIIPLCFYLKAKY